MTLKCLSCGAAEWLPDIRDLPYAYKGEPTVIKAVAGAFCPACDEAVFDAFESQRVSAAGHAGFPQTDKCSLVNPDFIAGQR